MSTTVIIYLEPRSMYTPAIDKSGLFINSLIRDVNALVYKGRELSIEEFHADFEKINNHRNVDQRQLRIKIYPDSTAVKEDDHSDPPLDDFDISEDEPDAETPPATEETKAPLPPSPPPSQLADNELLSFIKSLSKEHLHEYVAQQTQFQLDLSGGRQKLNRQAFDIVRASFPHFAPTPTK